MTMALRPPSSPSLGLLARALCGAQAASLVSDGCCVRAARWLRARVLRARGLLELKTPMGGLVNSMGSGLACRLRHAAAIPPGRADLCTVLWPPVWACPTCAGRVCGVVVCLCGGPATAAPRARVETWRGWRRHRSASAWWAIVPRSMCPGCASRTASWVLWVLALAARWGHPGARARWGRAPGHDGAAPCRLACVLLGGQRRESAGWPDAGARSPPSFTCCGGVF